MILHGKTEIFLCPLSEGEELKQLTCFARAARLFLHCLGPQLPFKSTLEGSQAMGSPVGNWKKSHVVLCLTATDVKKGSWVPTLNHVDLFFVNK